MAKFESKSIALVENKEIQLNEFCNDFTEHGLEHRDLQIKYDISSKSVELLVKTNNLVQKRAEFIRKGIEKIQELQINQAAKLLDIEVNFKKMRITQLEKTLEDYIAYYGKHNHFYKVHPLTGEILKSSDGIPMQLKLPNISKELAELKEGVNISEGVKVLATKLESIIHGKKEESLFDNADDIIDIGIMDKMFKKSESDDGN